MPYDLTSNLWPTRDEQFFRSTTLTPVRQSGLHCVSTVLGMLTGQAPETQVHQTQDPLRGPRPWLLLE